MAKEVISANPKAVDDYKEGKETAVKFLVGQLMAKTRGQADPEVAERVFRKLLA